MDVVRAPAVAGRFYPADSRTLRKLVSGFLEAASPPSIDAMSSFPKAIVAPHAGFVCSGPIAASAYARLLPGREIITRVLLLGPAHRVAVRGVATSSASDFATPLGTVPVDSDATSSLLDLPYVRVQDAAHQEEHSLEVHLPFLQRVLRSFRIVPLLVGVASAGQVEEILDRLWGGRETIIVISSDLSHYLSYDRARETDLATSKTVEALRSGVGPDEACGCRALNGLLSVARRRSLRPKAIDLRNSGDTLGSRGEVVGYGAFVFEE